MSTSTRKPSSRTAKSARSKAATAPDALTRYHYPSEMLDQPGFVWSANVHATVHLAMLSDTTDFVSPLMALLDQLRGEGYDIAAPYKEAVAMRAVIQQAGKAIMEIQDIVLRANFLSG